MKAIQRVARLLLAAVLMVCLLALTPSLALADKEYELASTQIWARVEPSGEMRVTEVRTLDLDGTFHGFVWAPLHFGECDYCIRTGQSIESTFFFVDIIEFTFPCSTNKYKFCMRTGSSISICNQSNFHNGSIIIKALATESLYH